MTGVKRRVVAGVVLALMLAGVLGVSSVALSPPRRSRADRSSGPLGRAGGVGMGAGAAGSGVAAGGSMVGAAGGASADGGAGAAGGTGGAGGAAADAARINFRAGDFPATWTAVPNPDPGPSPAGDPQTTALFACLHLPIAQRREIVDTDSPTFRPGPTLEATSNVTVVSPADLVAREITALKTPAGVTCLGDVISRSGASDGAGVSKATIGLIPIPPGGRVALGIRYQATLTRSGQSIHVATDEYFLTKGPDEITATFTALEAMFPAALETAALDRLVARV